jgi:hypothetical protein
MRRRNSWRQQQNKIAGINGLTGLGFRKLRYG